jgi:hypothetical protein
MRTTINTGTTYVCKRFAHSDTQELVVSGQLVAWRIDGEVYMMIGDGHDQNTAGWLNYMLGQMPGDTGERFRMNYEGTSKYVYQLPSNSNNCRLVGPHEIIRVST